MFRYKTSLLSRLAAAIILAATSLFIRVKIWFKKPLQAKTDEEVHVTVTGLDHDVPYEEYSEKIKALDDIIVKLGVHGRVSASHQYMYEMGRRDGALGIRLHNLPEIALATAQALLRHINVMLKGRLGKLNAEVNSAQSILQNYENVYNREQAYYDYVQYQYRFFPRNYSYLLFCVYLVFGIGLIIADIPLALELIKEGFGFAVPPEELSFSHLFDNPLGVLKANWETVTTATGIAFCTIYIKIYYDEFVGTPYANRAMTFKKFMEENNVIHSAETGKEVNGEHNRKGLIKAILAGITLLALIFIAGFRLRTIEANGDFDVNFFSASAFMAITILFPVIGGICMSYSLTNLQNLRRLSKARMKISTYQRSLQETVKQFTDLKKDYEDIKAAAEQFGNEEKVVEEYKNYLMAFYGRGYAIGGMQPEKYSKGEDFYSKILEWRNVAISSKINHHIAKTNKDEKNISVPGLYNGLAG